MLFKLSSITAIVLSLNGARAIVQYSGVNIAGFDFGCSSDVSILPSVTMMILNKSRASAHVMAQPPPFYRKDNGSCLMSADIGCTPTGLARWSISQETMA